MTTQGIETRQGGDAKQAPSRSDESPSGVAGAPNTSANTGLIQALERASRLISLYAANVPRHVRANTDAERQAIYDSLVSARQALSTLGEALTTPDALREALARTIVETVMAEIDGPDWGMDDEAAIKKVAGLIPLALTTTPLAGEVDWLPKEIGRLELGDRRSDQETTCSYSHMIADGSPLYWPQDMGEFDDRDPYCLTHAIEQAESDSSWCQTCIANDLAPENAAAPTRNIGEARNEALEEAPRPLETAPKDGSYYLMVGTNFDGSMAVVHWDDGLEWWTLDDGKNPDIWLRRENGLTGWLPLPALKSSTPVGEGLES